MSVCTRCGRENPGDARFCLACGSPLEQAPGEREVRKTVTVVFSDVTGSTRLGEERDPEAVRRVMSRYFEQSRAALERHGGTVEKFIGDAVMAVFGVPTVHEDDALRAVRAAAELRERLAALNDELEREWGIHVETRTAVNTGSVVAGSAETLVTGDAVNVAARLQQAAQPGEVLLGETTYSLVRDAVSAEATDPLELKGKREPVRAYRLLEVRRAPAGRERRIDSPMVGRDRQLALLPRALEQAMTDRACHLFTVLGVAGIGKTRLVEEFLRTLPVEATTLRGRCLPYGEGITYWPLAEAVREAAGITEDDSSELARRKVSSLVAGEEHAELLAERVAGLLGLPDAGSGNEDEAKWAARKLFERLAREQPLIVVFDDVHWAEPAFLDLLEHVTDWSRDLPMVLVCLARPELLDVRPSWGGGKLNATSVLLQPLADDDCAELIRGLLGRADVDDETRERITRAAEGNPLFVEEMLGMLVEDGLIARRDGGWSRTGDLTDVAVPPTIEALLSARLDRLAENERSLIERAAVEGVVFHRGGVVELAPEAVRSTVDDDLAMLMRRELVGPAQALLAGEEAFRFRHMLIRDVAYESMPKELRGRLHERFSDWLGRKAGDRLSEYEEVVAYHLEQAYRLRAELGPVTDADRSLASRAATMLSDAARRASARGDVRAQANLLERALAIVPTDAELRLELMLELGSNVGSGLGDYERAEQLLTEVAATARDVGDDRLEQYALVELDARRAFTDPAVTDEESRRINEQAIAVFEAAGDMRGVARAWRHMGQLNQFALRWTECREALERALPVAERLQDERELRGIRIGLVNALVWGPLPVPAAVERLERMLDDVRPRQLMVAVVSQGLALLQAMAGDFPTARRLLREARESFTDLGVPFRIGTSALFSGPVELLAGVSTAAEEALAEGREILRAHGETGVFSTLSGLYAEALYRQARYEDAERATRECEETASSGDVISNGLWRTVRAKVVARRGEVDSALRLSSEAVDLLGETDSLDNRGDAFLDRAEIETIAGRPAEAKADLERALEAYEQKGNVVSAARVRSLLAKAELEGASAGTS